MTRLHTLWPTHVLEDYLHLEEEEKQELIKLHEQYYEKYDHVIDILDPQRPGYNFFNEDTPAVQKLKDFAKSRVRSMMHIDQYLEPDVYDIEFLCVCRKMEPGERAKPHNHKDSHYVCVYYLDLDKNEKEGSDDKFPKGRLQLQDPNPNGKSRRQNWTMVHTLLPQTGMFVVHPSNLIHNSDPYEGQRLKRFFVIEARVIDTVKMIHYMQV